MGQYATNHADVFGLLCAPFKDDEVRTRQQGGRTLHYLTASTVANRLDDAVGPENWEFDLRVWDNDSLIGVLSIRLPDGTVVKKANVGGAAAMPEEDNSAKSAASDCLKRCAAMFGIGRYLYQCGWPEFAAPLFENFHGHPEQGGGHRGGGSYQGNGGNGGHRQQEQSDRERGRAEVNQQFRPSGNGGGGGNYGEPKTGGALFAWASRQDEQNPSLGLVKRIDGWAKQKGFNYKWKEWGPEQVAEAYANAQNVLGGGNGAGSPPPAPAAATIARDYAPSGAQEDDIPF